MPLSHREWVFIKAAVQLWAYFPKAQRLPEDVKFTLSLDHSPEGWPDSKVDALAARLDNMIARPDGALSKSDQYILIRALHLYRRDIDKRKGMRLSEKAMTLGEIDRLQTKLIPGPIDEAPARAD